uniref:Cysteine proteinase inhibitor n=1 Tax=Leersia perrieri TaxID=77586 RepID=A0A0D9VR22_9ORYZ
MRTFTAILLIVAVAFAAAATKPAAADDGSWTPIGSVASPHFQQFGQWVADELGAPIRFYRVVSGKRQNANGINYKFVVAMGNRVGVEDNYEVEVHVTVDRSPRALTPVAGEQ